MQKCKPKHELLFSSYYISHGKWTRESMLCYRSPPQQKVKLAQQGSDFNACPDITLFKSNESENFGEFITTKKYFPDIGTNEINPALRQSLHLTRDYNYAQITPRNSPLAEGETSAIIQARLNFLCNKKEAD